MELLRGAIAAQTKYTILVINSILICISSTMLNLLLTEEIYKHGFLVSYRLLQGWQ